MCRLTALPRVRPRRPDYSVGSDLLLRGWCAPAGELYRFQTDRHRHSVSHLYLFVTPSHASAISLFAESQVAFVKVSKRVL